MFDLLGDASISIKNGSSVVLDKNCSFDSFVTFSGNCLVSSGTKISSGVVLENTNVGINNTIRPYSIITNTTVESNNILGPFCFIRDQSLIKNSCIIGAHVEMTRSTISNNVKISHKAFIGDAWIGENVVIGAGTIFCNWNGSEHCLSEVGSNTLIGSGTLIISPVKIGSHCTIGAGSVVSKDVPRQSRFIQKRSN